MKLMPNHLSFKEKVSNLLNRLSPENGLSKKTNLYKYSNLKIDNHPNELDDMSKPISHIISIFLLNHFNM